MLNLVQLTELARRKPHQLSGGQKQRVALARADRQEAQGAAARRAAGRARPQAARGDAVRAGQHPGDAGPDLRHRHPRSGRGDDRLHPHRHHGSRPHRAGRHARRDLRVSEFALRRRVPGRGQRLRGPRRRGRARTTSACARRTAAATSSPIAASTPWRARRSTPPSGRRRSRSPRRAARYLGQLHRR